MGNGDQGHQPHIEKRQNGELEIRINGIDEKGRPTEFIKIIVSEQLATRYHEVIDLDTEGVLDMVNEMGFKISTIAPQYINAIKGINHPWQPVHDKALQAKIQAKKQARADRRQAGQQTDQDTHTAIDQMRGRHGGGQAQPIAESEDIQHQGGAPAPPEPPAEDPPKADPPPATEPPPAAPADDTTQPPAGDDVAAAVAGMQGRHGQDGGGDQGGQPGGDSDQSGEQTKQ